MIFFLKMLRSEATASVICLPGPGPGSVLYMIRERHVILKAALHSRLAV